MEVPSTSSGPENGESSRAAELGLEDAQRFMIEGTQAMREEDFDEAAECFSKALEIQVRHFGELAPECATTYYKYGSALFDKLQAEADPLGDSVTQNNGLQPSPPEVTGNGKGKEEAAGDGDEGDADEDGEGEEDKEEDEGDLEDAWKMLEFARVIHEKHGTCTIETVDIITKLADVNCFKEQYEACYDDYAKALQMLKQIVEPDSRILAELYFKMSMAYQLDLKPKDALRYCSHALLVCEDRVQRLRHELANAQTDVDGLGSSEANSSGDSKQSEVLKNGGLKDSQHTKEDLVNLRKDIPTTKMQSLPESLSTEIKEIEELLVDLKDKAEELKEMAAAPSLVEALQAANPEAAASMKQLFSLAAGSQAGGSNSRPVGDTSSSLGTSSSSAIADGTGGMTSNGFDAPSLTGNSSASIAVVTDLGVVGRGIKRAEPIAITGGSGNGRDAESQPKKRSLDNLMGGTGMGDTQVGFGNSSAE